AHAARDLSDQPRADRRLRRPGRHLWLADQPAQFHARVARPRPEPGLALCLGGRRRHADGDLRRGARGPLAAPLHAPAGRGAVMLLVACLAIFVALLLLSMPIVFALGIAGIAGLLIGHYPLQMLPSSLVGGSQNWVLLAIPSFIFAGTLMER